MWICVFLDLVQEDLGKVNWGRLGADNLTLEERVVLIELKVTPDLVNKKSNKEGYVVLLSEQM